MEKITMNIRNIKQSKLNLTQWDAMCTLNFMQYGATIVILIVAGFFIAAATVLPQHVETAIYGALALLFLAMICAIPATWYAKRKLVDKQIHQAAYAKNDELAQQEHLVDHEALVQMRQEHYQNHLLENKERDFLKKVLKNPTGLPHDLVTDIRKALALSQRYGSNCYDAVVYAQSKDALEHLENGLALCGKRSDAYRAIKAVIKQVKDELKDVKPAQEPARTQEAERVATPPPTDVVKTPEAEPTQATPQDTRTETSGCGNARPAKPKTQEQEAPAEAPTPTTAEKTAEPVTPEPEAKPIPEDALGDDDCGVVGPARVVKAADKPEEVQQATSPEMTEEKPDKPKASQTEPVEEANVDESVETEDVPKDTSTAETEKATAVAPKDEDYIPKPVVQNLNQQENFKTELPPELMKKLGIGEDLGINLPNDASEQAEEVTAPEGLPETLKEPPKISDSVEQSGTDRMARHRRGSTRTGSRQNTSRQPRTFRRIHLL